MPGITRISPPRSPEKADVVVVSVGGYPKDIDFIQSHKALEHARHAVKTGGTIILLGKCEDGLGTDISCPGSITRRARRWSPT